MSWVKIDDRAPEHRKQLAAGAVASWLWVCGLAYANRQPARDGFVPTAVLPMLYPIPGVAKQAERLVDAGLWERVDGGFQIHDYLDFQPSRTEVEQASARKAAAGRVGGRKSGEARRSRSEAGVEANAKHRASPVASLLPKPDPDPDPDPGPLPIPSRPDPIPATKIAPSAPLTLTGEPTGGKAKRTKAKKSTEDTAEPTPSADLTALRDHYVERYAATHDGQKPAFANATWSRAMGALKELLQLRGTLDAASIILTHAFADPWAAKNRCQPWELLADVNKHVTAPVVKTNGNQGHDYIGTKKKEFYQLSDAEQGAARRRARSTPQGANETTPPQWQVDEAEAEQRAKEAAGGGSNAS